MAKGEFAVIGTGEVPYGSYPDRSEFEIAYRVAKLAIEDAGIDKDEVGAVIGAAHIMGDSYNTELFFGRLPEAIGARNCKITASTISGGASSFSIRKTVEGILASGETDTVLVVHAQRFSQFSVNQLATYFAAAGSDPEWDVPYGMTYNSLAAMVTQAYLDRTPTTIEEVASVCVTLRKWAMLQPNAMFNSKELTVEKVLNSKMVAYPLTNLMCNVLADGGCAYVMTTAEKARRVCQKPVYVLSDASDYSHRSITSAKVKDFSGIVGSLGTLANRAYERAGLGPEDMDIFEIYASYPSVTLMVLDTLGVTEPGTSGQLVASGKCDPGGPFPISTNGEAMGMGHTGTGVGLSVFVESVRQLQGKAGRAQVEGARFLIENCGGGAFMDCHFTVLGNEVPGGFAS
jgi:acetyl-CoA C-acetyltransferase